MEVDARRLYLADGYSPLFAFCTQVLHLSEHAALGRIEVARAAKRLPALLPRLEDGSVTVTNVRMLAPHLTEANCEQLLASARHRSKREVEEMVARLRPQPDVRSAVRKLPSPPASEKPCVSPPRAAALEPLRDETLAAPPPTRVRPIIGPLAPERYKIQFTASKELLDKLRYAQDLLRHVTPSGDVAVVFDRALGALIEQLEKQKCGLAFRSRKAVACAPGSSPVCNFRAFPGGLAKAPAGCAEVFANPTKASVANEVTRPLGTKPPAPISLAPGRVLPPRVAPLKINPIRPVRVSSSGESRRHGCRLPLPLPSVTRAGTRSGPERVPMRELLGDFAPLITEDLFQRPAFNGLNQLPYGFAAGSRSRRRPSLRRSKAAEPFGDAQNMKQRDDCWSSRSDTARSRKNRPRPGRNRRPGTLGRS
jgi:hypothetical protein